MILQIDRLTLPGSRLALPREDGPRTEATLHAMAFLAKHAAGMASVQTIARAIVDDARVKGIPPARELFDFLKHRVHFKRDPAGVEQVRHPEDLLRYMADNGGEVEGDCDDRATLAAALLLAMGHPPAMVAFAVIAREGAGRWEHVHYAILAGRNVIPFDPQEVDRPGVWHAGTFHKLIFPLSKALTP